MISNLEIIQMIKDYKTMCETSKEKSKMFGLNNKFVDRRQAQIDILDQLLDEIDLNMNETEFELDWDEEEL